jgi:hypothetical protein
MKPEVVKANWGKHNFGLRRYTIPFAQYCF